MSCRLCEWPDVNIPAERVLIKLEIGLGYADASMPCRQRSVVLNRGIFFFFFATGDGNGDIGEKGI